MDVRNRMADVIKLRCNVCQDFLKLIITDNWQQFIYEKAKKEIDNNGRYKDKYISAYEKMREIGIDNYSIDSMDVTFISEIVHGCKEIAPTNDRTRKSIEQLVEDRNLIENVKFFCNIFSKKIFNIVYLLFIIYNDIIRLQLQLFLSSFLKKCIEKRLSSGSHFLYAPLSFILLIFPFH